MKKNERNREMLLPFKKDDVNFPKILEQCMKRLLGLKRKLLKNGKTQKIFDINHANVFLAEKLGKNALLFRLQKAAFGDEI